MVGKSHLLVGLTAGIVFDGFVHVTGPALVGSGNVPLSLIIDKTLFYVLVAFGSLLPDIDNARSTLGRKLGWISRGIQRKFGHRTLFHSFVGIVCGSAIAICIEQVVKYLLFSRGYAVPARIINSSHLIFIAVLFGCIMHIAADGLTLEGVPLLWPKRVYYGFPPNRRWRFRTGTWVEHVIVYAFMLLVAVGIYFSFIKI